MTDPRRLALTAARPAQLTAAMGVVDSTDTDNRTLSGMVLPFGEVGHTSIGPVRVAAGARIDWPADLRHVKLVDEHVKPPRSVGYVTAARQTPEGWRASIHVGRTELGEAALLEASEGLRDAFSVELDNLEFDAAGELIAARVTAIALVVTPAFPSARHDGMAASHHREDPRMLTAEQRERLAELLAIAPAERTDEQGTELAQLLELAGGQPEEQEQEQEQEPEPQREQLAAGQRPAPARVPDLGTRRRQTRQPELRELFAAQARVLSGRSRPELEAALTAITNTANIWVAADDYAGQLWSGLEYVRRFVQNSVSGPLNSYKGTGWRWGVKPEVNDYAGDKTAVPSNAPTTEDSSWTAARLAGAHDIDRKFWDFGDTEFIEAYYAAMRESYAVKSDNKALAFQLASAVSAGAAGTGIFRAAAVAAQAVEDATLGAPVDFIYINSADRLALLDLASADVPAYLEVFGVTPDKFQVAPGVAAGTVVAGSKQATRFRELGGGAPIRVEAINVANGGIDGGVFGYYATEEVHPGGIASATFL